MPALSIWAIPSELPDASGRALGLVAPTAVEVAAGELTGPIRASTSLAVPIEGRRADVSSPAATARVAGPDERCGRSETARIDPRTRTALALLNDLLAR